MLALDLRWLSTGIGRYSLGFTSELRNCGPIRLCAITSETNRGRIAPLADELRIVNSPIYGVAEQFTVASAAKGCKALHVPHYNAPLRFRGALLVTIHDIIHLLDPAVRDSWKSRLYARPILNAVSAKATRIFTVSEYSKRTIVEHLKIDPAKITVVYGGVDPSFGNVDRAAAKSKSASTIGNTRPYILYVGNLKPHKNVPTLIRAFAHLQQKGLEHSLVIVGDDRKGRTEIAELVASLGVSERVFMLPNASSEVLPSLYAGADVLVQPSFEEGFGLPVIEAMACGTPVVSSNAASLPEVGGDAAQYFNPHSVEELADQIRSTIEDSSQREKMIAAGRIRADHFTWRQCAQRHYDVYRCIAGALG